MTRSHILLVEDSPDLQELLWHALVGDGYTVSRTDTAEEALQSMHDRPADLMLSDIELPGMSGLALMRKLSINRAFPAISISGAVRYEDGQASTAAGFGAHLVKPFNLSVLLATITSLLHQGGDRRPVINRDHPFTSFTAQ